MAETFARRFTFRNESKLAPLGAADVAALEPAARAVAAIVWQRRHANEQASVVLAERLEREARAIGADDDVLAALGRLAADERAHVASCATVLDALGAPHAVAQPIVEASSFARDVVVGLCVCETVSAARFATVRAITDLPAFRGLIAGFLRDEIAHANLGFALLEVARAQATDTWLAAEAMRALLELEGVVGLDGERRGLPAPRPQPTNNPGVVEPSLDASAFYRAVRTRIVPRLEAGGVAIAEAWASRFVTPSSR